MKYFHSFDDFERLVHESQQLKDLEFLLEQIESDHLDEGLKDAVLAGLLALFAGAPLSAQDIKNVVTHTPDSTITTKTVNFQLNDKMSKEKADAIVKRMLSHGFKIQSEQMDTLWKEVKKTNPDTNVKILSIKFDRDSTFFESGKFILSDAAKADVEKAFETVLKLDGVVSHVKITSSTDKQRVSANLQSVLKGMGYAPNNTGLSEVRSDELKKYVENEIGLDSSLISVENLVEKGTGTIDASARFVRIDITYMCCRISPVEREADSPAKTIDYTVVLRKAVATPDQPSIGNFEEGKSKVFDKGKISNHSTPSSVKCTEW